MNRLHVIFVVLLVTPSLSGCLGPEDNRIQIEEPTPFDFASPVPGTTYYHFDGARNATEFYEINGTSVLYGNNIPIFSQGTYYSIGMSTFEPTVGVTSNDNLFMTSWGNGVAGSTAIVRCSGMIGMTNISEYSCEDVYDVAAPVANSNDPYLYVDMWNDRLMKFDMHALAGMTVEWSDNEGDSWIGPSVATGWSVQDHQTIANSPYPASLHDTTWVFCVNGNYPYPVCSASENGGLTWGPELPGAPTDCDSGGLTGHMIGSNNGNFYRGNRGCNGGEGYSIYRSTDGGITWTEHPLPTETTGTAETWNFEEAQVAADAEDNLHAMWMGFDNMPYYSYSYDEGGTWSNPIMVAPPGVNGTGFPTIAAGSSGRVAMGYIGTTNGGSTWNGYMTTMTDSFNENPLLTTVVVNTPDDPLDNAKSDCGYDRCGGFGDFIDIVIDQYGRPWFGLAHNPGGEIGIFGTFTEGPSLRSEGIEALASLPLGGPSTL